MVILQCFLLKRGISEISTENCVLYHILSVSIFLIHLIMVVVLESLLAKHFITMFQCLLKQLEVHSVKYLNMDFYVNEKNSSIQKIIEFHFTISVRESMLIDMAGIRNTNRSM